MAARKAGARRRRNRDRPILDAMLSFLARALSSLFDQFGVGPAFDGRWTAILALLRPPRLVPLGGDVRTEGPLLILAGHGAGWEDAAASLALAGHRVFVLVAPWPRLPRLSAFLRERRKQRGVHSELRGPRGSRALVEHLRGGGTAVVFVDTLRPNGDEGFVVGTSIVRPPTGLVGLAARTGADLAIAAPEGRGWAIVDRVTDLAKERADQRRLAERCARRLGAEVAAQRRRFLPVRAVTPALVVATGFGGCAAQGPAPADPWATESVAVRGIQWESEPPASVRLVAAGGEFQDLQGTPTARLEEVVVTMRADEALEVRWTAARLDGRWPRGPFRAVDVRWTGLDGQEDRIAALDVEADGLVRCGGCVLEGRHWEQWWKAP